MPLRDAFDQVALRLLQASVAVKAASGASTFSVQIQVRCALCPFCR